MSIQQQTFKGIQPTLKEPTLKEVTPKRIHNRQLRNLITSYSCHLHLM